MFKNDTFYWINQIEKASTVMTYKENIITKEIAIKVSKAIEQLATSEIRPTDYLDIQPMLLKLTGPKGSMIHVGRSRQDLLATVYRLLIRDRILELFKLTLETRSLFLGIAKKHVDTIVPSYTNGVQAQPVTLGHLFVGYENSIARTTKRIVDFFPRLNCSPLGGAALATSSFSINRKKLASLLGFDSCIDNAFDAVQLSGIDSGAETSSIASILALSVGTFIQDLHINFHHIRPWMLLSSSSLKSPSTLMPQKRNPVALNRARLLASEVIGDAVRTSLAAHNVNSGLTDYKRAEASDTLERACNMLIELNEILRGLTVDKEAGLDQVNADYSMTSELASALQRETNIPFKITHSFSSSLVTFGRTNRFKPSELPFNEVCSLYKDVCLKELGIEHKFPLSEKEFFKYLDPIYMVNSYAGYGGSKPSEVLSMLYRSNNELETHTAQLEKINNRLANYKSILNKEFSDILDLRH
ncbi:lyase family protein [Xenorhabdus doucetiae]|uniref:argininosuccinate lyase n=1 Tax=Xenorhabdus doucetiae TaxID=351671 RepID=A0A068QQ41_9GAMM|nr:lyase family protein [Xenorhabdus doucetiae]TYP16431.1 argininosuccinate lyase [Xenorhabdus doucetiae]CDG16914.1 Argininosuccinate lyase [Xenorhabdus doucetiae]